MQTVREKAQANLSGKMESQTVARETRSGAGQAEKGDLMSQDTQALIEAFVRDYAGERETQFRGRLAEILRQYGAEIQQVCIYDLR